MKKLLLPFTLALSLASPAFATPRCVVIHDGYCFETQADYDAYMGWGPEQQRLENEANR